MLSEYQGFIRGNIVVVVIVVGEGRLRGFSSFFKRFKLIKVGADV